MMCGLRGVLHACNLCLRLVVQVTSVNIDVLNCGADNDIQVHEGDVEITQYPWLGILYYSYDGEDDEARAVTTVALIQVEFVIAAAADIGPMPKHNFRSNAKVLLSEDWLRGGRGVRHYVLHPEYGETYNTVALVQLKTPVRSDYNNLQKRVVPVTYVPASLCKEFYVRANLYARRMRPPHVACAVSLEEERVCVWDAGAALVTRDVWGRWQLLGLGVRGPGCGAPSRYLDVMSYYPWIEDSLDKFRRISISKISKQKYVLRSSVAYQRFGNCDEEEKKNLVYRDRILLKTDNQLYQFMTYNLSLRENVEFTCMTVELVNASAVSEMRIHHYCRRETGGPACYQFHGSIFDMSVYLMFSDTCLFEVYAWGFRRDMTLINIQEWKWEEGTYYEDFTLMPVEYRGPTYQTEFGFEPVDPEMWVPDYDIWSTTEPSNISTTLRSLYAGAGTPPPREDTKHLGVFVANWTTLPTTQPKFMLYMTGKPYDMYGNRPQTTTPSSSMSEDTSTTEFKLNK